MEPAAVHRLHQCLRRLHQLRLLLEIRLKRRLHQELLDLRLQYQPLRLHLLDAAASTATMSAGPVPEAAASTPAPAPPADAPASTATISAGPVPEAAGTVFSATNENAVDDEEEIRGPEPASGSGGPDAAAGEDAQLQQDVDCPMIFNPIEQFNTLEEVTAFELRLKRAPALSTTFMAVRDMFQHGPDRAPIEVSNYTRGNRIPFSLPVCLICMQSHWRVLVRRTPNGMLYRLDNSGILSCGHGPWHRACLRRMHRSGTEMKCPICRQAIDLPGQ